MVQTIVIFLLDQFERDLSRDDNDSTTTTIILAVIDGDPLPVKENFRLYLILMYNHETVIAIIA